MSSSRRYVEEFTIAIEFKNPLELISAATDSFVTHETSRHVAKATAHSLFGCCVSRSRRTRSLAEYAATRSLAAILRRQLRSFDLSDEEASVTITQRGNNRLIFHVRVRDARDSVRRAAKNAGIATRLVVAVVPHEMIMKRIHRDALRAIADELTRRHVSASVAVTRKGTPPQTALISPQPATT